VRPSQGSPVSPILFLLYIEPIYRLGNPQGRFGYADDTAILSIGDTVDESTAVASSAIAEMQDSLDGHSFETPPLSDPTGVPNFPPEEGRAQDFQPFKLQYRDFKINPLPKQPLELFHLFINISLIQSWIK
jgi:hypothetical protein